MNKQAFPSVRISSFYNFNSNLSFCEFIESLIKNILVMRKPDRKTSLFKFMTVLKLEVWLSIVGALIVTGFMLWFVDKYSPYSARNNKKEYPYPCR